MNKTICVYVIAIFMIGIVMFTLLYFGISSWLGCFGIGKEMCFIDIQKNIFERIVEINGGI